MIKFFLLFFLLFAGNAFASECSLYETNHPAYKLDGSHLSSGKCTTCAFCHIKGVFMGTPNSCYLCHATAAVGTSVLQRSAKHIPTFAVTCGPVPGGCHSTTAFTPVSSVTMNHTIVSAYRCDSCHNPNTTTCLYSSYNATCQPKDHPSSAKKTGATVSTSLVGVDCAATGYSGGCHSTSTFDK